MTRHLRLDSSATQVVATTGAILAAQAVGGIILARGLGPANRGILAALMLWAATASDIAAFGTPSGVSYWAASGLPRTAFRILKRLLPWMIATSVGIFLVIAFASGRSDDLPTFGIVVMAVWAGGQLIHAPLQRLQQGLRRMTAFNGLRVIAEIGPTVGYAVFAVAGVLTVTTGTASIAISMFIALAVGAILARQAAEGSTLDAALPQESKQPDTAERRRFWNYSGRSWLSILAGRSNATVDLLLLTLLAVPAESIGFYAVAATSTSVIAVLGGSLGLDLFPRIAEIGGDGDGWPLLRKFIGVNAAFSALAAAAFFVIADWLIPLVYGEAFSDSVAPARMLLIGVVAVSVSRVAGEGLAGMDHPGQQAVAQVVGAAITVVGIILVDTNSLVAVAGAASAGFIATALLMLIFTWRSANRLYAS